MEIVLDREQAKALDAAAMQGLGIPSFALMEQAACALTAQAVQMRRGDGPVLAVCGPGNNGADALASVRQLLARGVPAQAVLVGDPSRGTPEYQTHLSVIRKLGAPVFEGFPDDLPEPSLWIDGLFGIGLTREVGGAFAQAVERINASAAPVLAADVPSGLDATSGEILGICVRAQATVTFGRIKAGCLLGHGPEVCGELITAPLDYPASCLEAARPGYRALEKSDLSLLPVRPARGHKGTFGKVLVIAGQKNMAGAACLAASAAYRCGAGLVRVLTPEANRVIVQTRVPEALLTTYDPAALTAADGGGRQSEEIRERAARLVREAADGASSIVIGPGLGRGAHVAPLLRSVLEETGVPLVIDADALNTLAAGEVSWDGAAGRSVITPHIGEMARITGQSAAEVRRRAAETARAVAAEKKVVCVLKDACTVTAAPEGPVFLNRSGNQGMGTGGSGDVLSGVIGTLLAGMTDRTAAAALGVYLHGLAGDDAADHVSRRALMAGDLLRSLTRVLARAEKT